MRIIQRLGSISFALVFPVALSTGAFAQTESPINVNSADASAHAKAIDGLTFKHGALTVWAAATMRTMAA